MKKGFTMIELIFVIVILGILASVAIPRLAATREDAEISAAVANLRTLVSDVSAYYVVKGEFPTGTKWKDLTNVPVSNSENEFVTSTSLKVGGKDCIDFLVRNKNGDKPAYILFAKKSNGNGSAVCKQVQDSEPLKVYFTPTVIDNNGATTSNGKGSIAIGSSTSVY
ncbi:MAG: prepilin-type N-terminal cleavage/methylation domain-containing protein [Campylobacter sp.]|uniref:type II secretion system protein n=1 Tax=Campylobacter sp. TaxID=205 RepID=UPI002AA8C720|nr:prepilin-type N-terminal cleavage/methylation domain-containing protein [Campylobacter sp.]MCI6178558.1 prepilin-type N-terminal cleavage/methylation domain-containing protein [Campylobacter sp.]